MATPFGRRDDRARRRQVLVDQATHWSTSCGLRHPGDHISYDDGACLAIQDSRAIYAPASGPNDEREASLRLTSNRARSARADGLHDPRGVPGSVRRGWLQVAALRA